MSIGGEETKGNEVTKETFSLLSGSSVNFHGNIEGHDLFMGEQDVVVCDGFVGNIVLKTSESVAVAVATWLRGAFTATPFTKMGAFLLRDALRSLKKQMDPEMHGGAPLLGVNGVCIITHGSSSGTAIFHAVKSACDSLHQHLNSLIVDELEKNGFSA